MTVGQLAVWLHSVLADNFAYVEPYNAETDEVLGTCVDGRIHLHALALRLAVEVINKVAPGAVEI